MLRWKHIPNTEKGNDYLFSIQYKINKNKYDLVLKQIRSIKYTIGDCYIYLWDKINKDYYFTKINRKIKNYLYHGFVVKNNEIESRPTEYFENIDFIANDHVGEINDDGYIPENNDIFSITRFSKKYIENIEMFYDIIIDKVIFGNKIIVLKSIDERKIFEYIKFIYSLLPIQYSKTIGFITNMNDFSNISNFKNLGIKIIGTTEEVNKNFSYILDVIDIDNYIFDKINLMGKYSKKLSSFSDDIKNEHFDSLNSFIDNLFTIIDNDTSLNIELLDFNINKINFISEQNIENANILLNYLIENKYSIEDENLINLINILLDTNEINNKSFNWIKLKRLESYIAKETNYNYIHYIINNELVKSNEKEIVDLMINLSMSCDNNLMEFANLTIDKYRKNESIMSSVFECYIKCYLKLTTTNSRNYLLKAFSQFNDINYTYDSVIEDQIFVLLKILLNKNYTSEYSLSKNEYYLYLNSMILSSCCPFNSDLIVENNRLNNFIKSIEENSKVTNFILILDIYNILKDCDINYNNPDILFTKEFFADLISIIDFQNCLKLANDNFEKIIETSDYLPMFFVNKLSNIDEFQININSITLVESYKSFISNYKEYISNIEELRNKLQLINKSLENNVDLLDFRNNFIIGLYNNLSNKSLMELNRDFNKYINDNFSIKRKEELNLTNNPDILEFISNNNVYYYEKQIIIENIILKSKIENKIFNLNKNNSKQFYFWLSCLITIIYGLLSITLLISPYYIISSSLEVELITYMIDKIQTITFFIPLLSLFIVFFGYLLYNKMKNNNYVFSLKKIIINGFLYCILPCILYITAYLLTYFLM